MKNINLNKVLFAMVIVFSLLSLSMKIITLWQGSTAFTYDQGRDLLDLRAMVVDQKISLIGPTTSLHGIFSGPFWYWFSLPIYILTGGHPLSTEIFLLIVSFSLPVFAYVLISDKKIGFILSTLYIFANSCFGHSIVALNTNPVIFITPLIIISSAEYFVQKKERYLMLASILLGTFFHFEALVGLYFIPVIFGIIIKQKSFKSLIAFVIPLLPLALFDLRHNFIQTRALISLILGKGDSLTDSSMKLVDRVGDRINLFGNMFTNESGNNFLLIFFIFGILVLISKIVRIRKSKADLLFFLGVISFLLLLSLLGGFILYPYAIWPWYLGAGYSLILTLFGLGLAALLISNHNFKVLIPIILSLFVLLNVRSYFFVTLPLKQSVSIDAANLRTRSQVVDQIYNDSQGKGMKIYTFAPYVYDYPYQYLIWWKAKTQYKYLPEEYAYLTNQPLYVAAKVKADTLIPNKKSECTYLIIEPFESQEKWYWDWRYRFPESQKTWVFGNTKVEKLCK